jgi:hypothetical protein
MTKTIRLKAEEKATIFRRNFSSVPIAYRFQAVALDGRKLAGEVEVQGSNWIFPKPPSMQALQADNVVHAGFWDTFFRVSVIAHRDLEVSIPTRGYHVMRWPIWFGVLVLIIATVILFLAG